MHFKDSIWAFIKDKENLLKTSGIYIFFSEEILFSRFFIDEMKQKIDKDKLKVFTGDEICVDKFENLFKSLDLFGNCDSFLIHLSEKIPASTHKLFLNNDYLSEEQYLIFIFNQKNDFYKDLLSDKNVSSFEINPVKFWEGHHLLGFLCEQLQIELTEKAKELLLESVELDSLEIYNLLSRLKISSNDSVIDDKFLSSELSKSKVDYFELGDLFCQKKFKAFYNILIERHENLQATSFLQFMQSHMVKVLDPTYTDKKKKLSNYDKKIKQFSNSWTKDNLLRSIRYFKELEESVRTNEHLFIPMIKRDFLRTYTR